MTAPAQDEERVRTTPTQGATQSPCACIRAEGPLCHPDCWHFGNHQSWCRNCGEGSPPAQPAEPGGGDERHRIGLVDNALYVAQYGHGDERWGVARKMLLAAITQTSSQKN